MLYLRMLEGMLDDKRKTLEQILAITENQAVVLDGEQDSFAKAMYSGMSGEKQKLIDAVIESDKIFETVFQEIGDSFEEKAPGNKQIVSRLQDQIRAVTAVDANIRIQEARNEDLKKRKKITHTLSPNKLFALYARNK
jgi:hypothetical protein